MRRSLAFITRHRASPEKPILRLFWFNDKQAAFVDRAVRGLVEAGVSFAKAHELAEGVVLAYLQGREPNGSLPKALLLGRALFPMLTDAEVERLPRSGAPGGRIAVLVFQIESTGEPKRMRAVRYDLNREQARAYNAALFDVQKWLKVNRDEAWHQTNKLVGRLLNGAAVVDENAQPFVRNLAAVFSQTDLWKLPDATEEDLRTWTFTSAPLLSVVES